MSDCPQCPDTPSDATRTQLVQQLSLGVIRRPASDPVRQCGSRHTRHDPQLNLQWKQTFATRLQRLVAIAHQLDRPEQAIQIPQGRRVAPPIIVAIPEKLARHFRTLLGFQTIHRPLHNPSAQFPQQAVQFHFKLNHGGGRNLAAAKAARQASDLQQDRTNFDQQSVTRHPNHDCQISGGSRSILHGGVPSVDCRPGNQQNAPGTPLLDRPLLANTDIKPVCFSFSRFPPHSSGAERIAPPRSHPRLVFSVRRALRFFGVRQFIADSRR